MTIFDLLFLTLTASTALSILTLLGLLVTGRIHLARRACRYLAAAWAAYMIAVISVSPAFPQRVLGPGVPCCFDDWCISILDAEAAGTPASLKLKVEISSRALRVVQRERGIRLYLADASGHKYQNPARCSGVPLDAMLAPGEHLKSTCVFEPVTITATISVLIGHDDGFPIRWFIIGEEAWFRPPTVVRVPVVGMAQGV